MDNDYIHRFLQHPRRPWIAIGAAVVILLIFALPAWDDLNSAQRRHAEAASELEEIQRDIANLEPMRQRVRTVSSSDAAQETMNAAVAEDLREQVVRLAFSLECRTRRVTLSDPVKRPWGMNDHPFQVVNPKQDEETKYELETRTLDLTVSGSLVKLSKLLTRLNGLNRFAVPTNMILQREGQSEELRLDVTLSLFNLLATND
ncbi:MAG: hypothetical protein R3C05_06175 [Pirellulaceae bacterium]